MLRIRLARTGKKKQANYRIVVADQRRAVTAKFKEILGWYNPHTKESKIDKEKVQGWLEKGANPSNSIATLFKKNGVELPKWVKIVEKNKKSKKAKDAESETAKSHPASPEADNAKAQSEKNESAKTEEEAEEQNGGEEGAKKKDEEAKE